MCPIATYRKSAMEKYTSRDPPSIDQLWLSMLILSSPPPIDRLLLVLCLAEKHGKRRNIVSIALLLLFAWLQCMTLDSTSGRKGWNTRQTKWYYPRERYVWYKPRLNIGWGVNRVAKAGFVCLAFQVTTRYISSLSFSQNQDPSLSPTLFLTCISPLSTALLASAFTTITLAACLSYDILTCAFCFNIRHQLSTPTWFCFITGNNTMSIEASIYYPHGHRAYTFEEGYHYRVRNSIQALLSSCAILPKWRESQYHHAMCLFPCCTYSLSLASEFRKLVGIPYNKAEEFFYSNQI